VTGSAVVVSATIIPTKDETSSLELSLALALPALAVVPKDLKIAIIITMSTMIYGPNNSDRGEELNPQCRHRSGSMRTIIKAGTEGHSLLRSCLIIILLLLLLLLLLPLLLPLPLPWLLMMVIMQSARNLMTADQMKTFGA
jgi:hypothetical protein